MNSYDWLEIIKVWCSEEKLLNNLTLAQQGKLANRLSFFFIDNPSKVGDIEDDMRIYFSNIG